MADEIANSTPAPAASPAGNPSEAAPPPATETPATAPNTTAPVTAPVETAPAAEPVKTDAPVDAAPKTETLLAQDKKVEEKPAEVKVEAEKPVEASTLPAYEPFTLPENIQFDDNKMGEFTKVLGEFEALTKAPHDEVQKLGQSLVDRHLGEMQRYTESLTQAWEKQKTDWKDSFLKSPEFADRTDAVVNAAIDAINVYGGDAKQQSEFRELMETTGVGNHPAMIRLLANVVQAKAEPKPLAAPTIAPKATNSKIERMYGKKTA